MARTVGAKNKIPQAAKENIAAVFVRLGGTAKMAEWAEENKTEFYRIYARLLPHELSSDQKKPGAAVLIWGKSD